MRDRLARLPAPPLWVPSKLLSEEEYAKAMVESDRQRRRYLAPTDRLGPDEAIVALAAR